MLRRQGSCPVCKYRIHRNHDDPETDNENHADEDDERADGGQGVGESSRTHTTTTAVDVSTSREMPRISASADATLNTFIHECNDDDRDDAAPLLSKSESGPSWLSGGQLPHRGTTWLGYGNSVEYFVCDIVFQLYCCI